MEHQLKCFKYSEIAQNTVNAGINKEIKNNFIALSLLLFVNHGGVILVTLGRIKEN